MKQIAWSIMLVLLLATRASAGYFTFTVPGFEEKVIKEQVENGDTILTTINTVALDLAGNIYYLKSDRSRVLGASDTYTWQELETITYSVKIALVDSLGEERLLAEGALPLKSEVAGILFDSRRRRLVVFVKSMGIDQSCSFLNRAVCFGAQDLRAGAKAWNWSGLESCIREYLSILEIRGFGTVTPF